MTPREKALDRVVKLRALAAGGTTAGESDAARSRAAAIMRSTGLTEDEVRSAEAARTRAQGSRIAQAREQQRGTTSARPSGGPAPEDVIRDMWAAVNEAKRRAAMRPHAFEPASVVTDYRSARSYVGPCRVCGSTDQYAQQHRGVRRPDPVVRPGRTPDPFDIGDMYDFKDIFAQAVRAGTAAAREHCQHAWMKVARVESTENTRGRELFRCQKCGAQMTQVT